MFVTGDDVTSLFRQAGSLQNAGRRDEAGEIYSRILALSPDHVDSRYQLGAIAHRRGRHDEALDHLRKAIILVPEASPLHYNQGLAHQAMAQPAKAVRSYRRAMLLAPGDADARCNLGNALQLNGEDADATLQYRIGLAIDPAADRLLYNYALSQSGLEKRPKAVSLYRRTLLLRPFYINALCNLGTHLGAQGNPQGAASCYRRALAVDPADPEVAYNLGNAHRDSGDAASAIRDYKRAVLITPSFADALYNLGNVLLDQGLAPDAIAHYESALSIRPDHPETLYNLGMALHECGRREEAVSRFREAMETQPLYPDLFFCNLGIAFTHAGLHEEAILNFNRALASVAENPDALNNLGVTIYDLGDFPQAANQYKKALALCPDHKYSFSNFGNALKAMGALSEALASYRRACLCDPRFAVAHSNLLLTQLYQPDGGLPQILTAAREWNSAHGTPAGTIKPLRRRLREAPRVGFLSGDFRRHAVGYLVVPTLEELARRGHRLFLYHNSGHEDEMTERFRAAATDWRSVFRLSDERLGEIVKEDEIDILFDLSGHSAGNRLPALATRLAPIQVGWAGYPATTGVEAMDYIVGDARQVPDAERPFYQEQVIRLPDSYLCYEALRTAPPLTGSPWQTNGYVTFGSFNEISKLSRTTIKAWAAILRAVDGSQLILKSPRFSNLASRAHYVQWFEEDGISADRLEFIGQTSPADHMGCMSMADIALDSFPYTGGLTTLETLWMGAPVVTLAGQGIFARHAAGYLTTAGLTELVADDVDHYVSLATDLANDRRRLTALRRDLRRHMKESPLCDIERFTNHFETMLDYIWWRHAAGEAPAPFDIGLP